MVSSLAKGWKGMVLVIRRYRLHNLSICLLHSLISGSWALTFAVLNHEVMLHDTLHWYAPWASLLPIMSIAYFTSDSLDMLRHEISSWTIELFFHHGASSVAFLFAILSHKFVPYAYWALLMEVNSVFLHCRSIMQLSGAAETKPSLFALVKGVNIATFVVFRFCVQGWQLCWAWRARHLFHTSYAVVAIGGGLTFLTINIILFYRIISSDGLLGDRFKAKAGTSRDDQTFVKSISQESEKKNA